MQSYITVYGYTLYVPLDVSTSMVLTMNELVEEPFHIYNLCISIDTDDLDKEVLLVIGFIPDAELQYTVQMAKELEAYIVDNPIFQGFNFDKSPEFYAGIEEDADDLDDSDDSNSDDSNSDDSNSDSDEEKQ